MCQVLLEKAVDVDVIATDVRGNEEAGHLPHTHRSCNCNAES